ncbi:zinc ABC transporter substrate-binding protein [Candidatus Saccharibacteria bacterium]|nr:zinc ABC transporter substrate-binding protein [Candidatus Saccharibacteria bacterium]
MKKIIRNTYLAIIAIDILLLIFVPIHPQSNSKDKPNIVSSLFIGYDIVRNLTKDTAIKAKMLLPAGAELHSYEPSPQDIITIKESDIFIYNGGESEEWLEDIVDEIDQTKTTIIRMMDYVELLEEDDEAGEYDEHIWTSPKNVQIIYSKITPVIVQKYPEFANRIQANFEAQNNALAKLDQDFRTLASTKTGKLIVADRFPLRYFVEEYGFDYYAAFPGCAEQTEANAKTISELINAVNESPKKVIFHIELSNQSIANTIKDATGAKILEFHSVHNISQSDFDAGKTYIDFMRQNYNNLNETLYVPSES